MHRRLARLGSVKRGYCLFLLLVAGCLLVLLQALQLPKAAAVTAADRGKNVTGRRHQLANRDSHKQQLVPPFVGPVPSICYGPDSTCLTGLFLLPQQTSQQQHSQELGKTKAADEGYRIPAIVHLLAMESSSATGSNFPASVFSRFLFDWHRLHTNWTYVLWTDDEVGHLVRVFYRRYLPLVAASSPEVLAHLVPLLIVQKYGGVVVSPDRRPTRSVDPLRRLPAVFSVTGRWPRVSASQPGLFMAAPGHPFVQYCTDRTLHSPTGHGGLTRLLLDYGAAFPVTEWPDHSVHLAQLDASLKTASDDVAGDSGSVDGGSGGSGGGSRVFGHGNLDGRIVSSVDQHQRLRAMLRRCQEKLGRSLAESEAAADTASGSSPLPGIGCSELRELRSFLKITGGGAFVRTTSAKRTIAASGDDLSQRTEMKLAQLASVFSFLNVGLQRAWAAYR